MTWYQNQNWSDELHREFYERYKSAAPDLQEKALIEQATLLCKHLDNTTLKAAESLLILWISRHYNKANAAQVYELMQDICSRIGDHERAAEFKKKRASL